MNKRLAAGVFGGSVILLIMTNLFNAINYFFQFIMARLLVPSEYGVLATLMSMLFIFSLASESIQTIMTKYTSNEKDSGKIKNILKRFLRKSLKIAVFLFFVYLALAIFLVKFLRIEYSLLALTGLFIFAVFLVPINRGILQGKRRFNALGWNMVIEASVKLILAVLLVYAGWKVYGAIFAVFAGSMFAFLVSFINMKKVLASNEKDSGITDSYSYSMNVFTVIATVTIFYSLDIILARSFFPDHIAGLYALASVLSKSIFFATLPISKVMFPMSSEASVNGQKSRHVFFKALALLGLCVFLALIVVAVFPDLLIRIFSGSYYSESAAVLPYVAISIGLISLTNLILLYKLSLGKSRSYKRIGFFILLEIVLLSLFHGSLIEYSLAFIAANVSFLLGSILLFNR